MDEHRLALEAWESLFRAQHAAFAAMSDDFNHELTQGEYDVLLTVTRGKQYGARLKDVTTNMLISQPSVSRLVDKMVSKGYLVKSEDPSDRRGYYLEATDAGRQAFHAVAVRHSHSILHQMREFDEAELRQLILLSNKLRKTARSWR